MIGTVRFFRNPSCFRGGQWTIQGPRTRTASRTINLAKLWTWWGMWGSGCTLAWHYLVLFSPVFGDLSRGAGYSFERQFALYSSIAVTFLLILLLSRKDGNKAGARWHRKALPAFVGAAGTVTSALYAVCVVFAPGDAPCLAVVAMIGVCESALMALWLHAVAKRRSPLPLRSFGVYMIVGGLSAAVVSFTMWPLGPAITACLPVVSALLLAKAYPSRPETAKDAGAFKTPPPRQKPKILDAMQRRHEQRTASLPSSRKARPNTP